jgi:outer membrane protein assembly factor BamE (lipoprotein component of BamABCDE complex)
MPVVRLVQAAAMLLLLSVIGCDPGGRALEDLRLAKLKAGVSTEQDVRRLFGAPPAVRVSGATKGLVYPLGPEGLYTLLLSIGADGKYVGHENLLTRANFDRIRPGLQQSEVQLLLGPPGSTQSYALKQQRAWEWRFLDGQEARIFVVMFDNAGVVVSTAIEEDPRRQGGS